MTRRRTHGRAGAASASPPARAYQRGIVVVHGIGSSKAGDTRDAFARSIRRGVADAGRAARVTDITVPGGPPQSRIDIDHAPSVLLAEAYWADAISSLGGWSARRAVRQLLALIRMLPFLLAGALGPRAHEPDLADDSSETVWRQLRALAPTLWRMATLYGVIIGASLLVSAAATQPWIAAVLIATALLLVALLGTSRLLGQVRVAAMDDGAIAPALDRIRAALAHAETMCDEVWVIAHSQGGYLAHRVLTEDGRNAHPRVKRVTGIASGLRPIQLAAVARSARWTASGWIMLTSGVLAAVFLVLMLTPGGLLSPSTLSGYLTSTFLILVQPAALLDLTTGVALLASAQEAAIAAIAWRAIDTFRLATIALVVALALAAIWVRKGTPLPAPVAALPARTRWEELTSPSDLVGSVSVPALPATVHQVVLPALRNPIGDHFLGTLLRGPVALRALLSERLLDRTSFAANQLPVRFAPLSESLLNLSHRTYALRGLLLACVVALTLGFPFVIGGSVIDRARDGCVYGSYVAVSVASAAVAGLWWWIGATRRVRAYRERTAYPSPRAISPSYIRFLWISGAASSAGALVIAYVTAIVPTAATPVIGGLGILGVAMLLAACVASVRVQLPRVILWMTLLLFTVPAVVATMALGAEVLSPLGIVMVLPGVLLAWLCIALAAVALLQQA